MKKLHDNFTTPEQSRRLLELGVPADSADMYSCLEFEHLIWIRNTKDESSEDFFDILINGKSINIPIWSAGRLIEIFIICTPFVEIRLRTRLIEQLIASYEDVIKQGLIDFSKLED